jgi:hypothetical protein
MVYCLGKNRIRQAVCVRVGEAAGAKEGHGLEIVSFLGWEGVEVASNHCGVVGHMTNTLSGTFRAFANFRSVANEGFVRLPVSSIDKYASVIPVLWAS